MYINKLVSDLSLELIQENYTILLQQIFIVFKIHIKSSLIQLLPTLELLQQIHILTTQFNLK